METAKRQQGTEPYLADEEALWDTLPLREQVALLEWRWRQAEKSAEIVPFSPK